MYTYIYIYTHTYVYVYIYIYMHTCICMYVYIYVCIYIYIYIYTHLKVHMSCEAMSYVDERLAEYGRKTHRGGLAQTYLSRDSIYWYVCVTHRGVRFHRTRDFRQN